MLQQSFHNWSVVPKMYLGNMNNMYSQGSGYFGKTLSGNYNGWKAYKSGEGFVYKDDILCNYNLIFKL